MAHVRPNPTRFPGGGSLKYLGTVATPKIKVYL
jgi:hypothetical protein